MNVVTRRSLALATAVVVSAGLAACSAGSAGAPTSTGPVGAGMVTPDAGGTPVSAAAAGLVGPGCAAFTAAAAGGSGSVDGMARDPLATAAANNPLLTKLTAAVSGKLNKKVNLVQTLNGGTFTVFAPVDAAFAKLPAQTVATLRSSKNSVMLTNLLTYHVIAGRLDPARLVGTQKTVEGADVKVTGSGNSMKVNGANVICGGVKTANATVYLIDRVLSLPKK
jgi:uncharacterized surface protein with fasciclin (FAS1) repeats